MGVSETPPDKNGQPDTVTEVITDTEAYLASLVNQLLAIGLSGEITLSQIHPTQKLCWVKIDNQLDIIIKGTFGIGVRVILAPKYISIFIDTYLPSNGPYPRPAQILVYTYMYSSNLPRQQSGPRRIGVSLQGLDGHDHDLAQQIPRQGTTTLPGRIDCAQTAAAVIELALRFHDLSETDPSRNKPTNLVSLLVVPATETPAVLIPA